MLTKNYSWETFNQVTFRKYFTVKNIALNGMIAALYTVLTITCGPLGYGFMQFRFSEMFNLFVFFNPSATVGLTIGCLISNLFSTAGLIDVLLGTATTFIGCIMMILYSKIVKNLFTTSLIPCLLNALVVPITVYISCLGTNSSFILNPSIYFVMFGWVFLGELVCVTCVGYPIFMILTKTNPSFYRLIDATNNLDYKW